MRRHLLRTRGSILLLVFIISATIMTVAVGFFNYLGSAVHAERFALASSQARMLAEAGIDKAVYELNQNGNYSGENDTALGTGTFTTSISSINNNTKRVTVTAAVANTARPTATKTVKATISINSSIVSFRYGVQIGTGGVTMGGGSVIYGNLFSNGNISGSGTITGDATVAAGTDSVADQQWITQNSSFNVGDVSAHVCVPQWFQPSFSASLARISVYMKKNGNPGDLAIKVVSDNNGKPSTTVLATGIIPASLLTPSFGFAEATLDGTPLLTANQTYWIIAIMPVSATNYFKWGLDTNGGYTRGASKYSSNWNAQSPTWNSITGDLDFKIYLTGTSTSISGVTVQGNAWAYALSNCSIGGNALYQIISNCSVASTTYPGTAPATPAPLPISDAQIADWEDIATAGGILAGPYAVSGTQTLGPKKIQGDLIVTNNAILKLSGPVWVNGNIEISNNGELSVSPDTGTSGAILIADATGNTVIKGTVNLSNNAVINGNGNANTFPMIISTNTGAHAILISNNAASVILYAPYGSVEVSNGADANQITAYRLELENNSSVTYVNGLQNSSFSNGPGGSWAVVPGTYAITN